MVLHSPKCRDFIYPTLIGLNKFRIIIIGAKTSNINISVNLKKSFTYFFTTFVFFTYTQLRFNQKN